MWDDRKQRRVEHLCETALHRTLQESERAVLAALLAERCGHEAVTLAETTRSTEEENARLAAKVQDIETQNAALEALIQEQEAYLVEVETLVAQMEARRRNWRERYAQVTGKALD